MRDISAAEEIATPVERPSWATGPTTGGNHVGRRAAGGVQNFLDGQEAIAVAIHGIELIPRAAALLPFVNGHLGITVCVGLRKPFRQFLGKFTCPIDDGLLVFLTFLDVRVCAPLAAVATQDLRQPRLQRRWLWGSRSDGVRPSVSDHC